MNMEIRKFPWLMTAVAASMLLSPAALALSGKHHNDHGRWLHFMGTRASAHAIDTQYLHVLDNGLLASATRYPRTSAAGWTDAQNRKGYYEYIERLIDCHTGLSTDIAISLLDKNNQPVARRSFDRDHQIEQVALRWTQVARHKWPDHSETWLACVAAAQPTSVDDAHLPDSPEGWYFDVAKVGDAPPSTMRGVFQRLRKQYEKHLAGYLALLAPARVDNDKTATRAQGERWHKVQAGYHRVYIDTHSLQSDGHGVIEYTRRTKTSRGRQPRWPEQLPRQVVLDTRYMADCRNGLTIPVEQTFRALPDEKSASKNTTHKKSANQRTGKVLLTRPTPVVATLEAMTGRRSRREKLAWTQWHGPSAGNDGATAYMCQVAARRCGAKPLTHPFEIDPTEIAKHTATPVLESARAQWLHYRATFVPSCPIQAK